MTSVASALLLVVPEAEPVVGEHRARHDLAAQVGVPTHITVAFPFVPEPSRADLDEVERLCRATAPIDLVLGRTGWFGDDVLFLEPDDPAPVVALSRAVEAAFPDFPLYGGAFADIHPHLTVAHGTHAEVLRGIEADVTPCLPVAQRAVELQLWSGPPLATRRPGWRLVRSFPLAG